MKPQFSLAFFLIGAVMLVSAGCSAGTPTTNQTAPTAVVAATQATNAQSATAPAATLATSAQPTATTAAPTEAPAATATNAPPASGSDAFNLIASALQAQLSSKSFRSTSVSTSGNGTSTTVIEYVAPDRIHLIRTNSGAATPSETIAIKGKGSWQKTGGKWEKSPVDLSDIVFAFLDPKNLDQLKSTIDLGTVQFVGAELLGTTPTFVYQYDQDIKGAGAGGADLKGTYKVWVGATDHRVYKVEGDSDSATKAGAKIHTLVTYEYDLNIQIDQPI